MLCSNMKWRCRFYTKNIGHWAVLWKLDLEFFFPECRRICVDHFTSSYYYCNSHYRQVPMPGNQSLSMEPIRDKRHVKRLKLKPHFSRLLLCHQPVEFRCPDTRPKAWFIFSFLEQGQPGFTLDPWDWDCILQLFITN